jgi:hypothetical protein
MNQAATKTCLAYPSTLKMNASWSVFRDKNGILLIDYLEKGATITAKYYVALLDKLKQQLVSKRREKLSSFFKTMLLLTRRPLRAKNWQIFILKF